MPLEIGIDTVEAWRIIKGNANAIKNNAPGMITFLANNDVRLEYIFEIYKLVKESQLQLDEMKTVSGLVDYVKTARNDPVYDVVAQITALTAAQQLILDWIDSNAAGLSLTGDSAANALANKSVVTNRFTPTQTSQLQVRLQNMLSTIS